MIISFHTSQRTLHGYMFDIFVQALQGVCLCGFTICICWMLTSQGVMWQSCQHSLFHSKFTLYMCSCGAHSWVWWSGWLAWLPEASNPPSSACLLTFWKNPCCKYTVTVPYVVHYSYNCFFPGTFQHNPGLNASKHNGNVCC